MSGRFFHRRDKVSSLANPTDERQLKDILDGIGPDPIQNKAGYPVSDEEIQQRLIENPCFPDKTFRRVGPNVIITNDAVVFFTKPFPDKRSFMFNVEREDFCDELPGCLYRFARQLTAFDRKIYNDVLKAGKILLSRRPRWPRRRFRPRPVPFYWRVAKRRSPKPGIPCLLVLEDKRCIMLTSYLTEEGTVSWKGIERRNARVKFWAPIILPQKDNIEYYHRAGFLEAHGNRGLRCKEEAVTFGHKEQDDVTITDNDE